MQNLNKNKMDCLGTKKINIISFFLMVRTNMIYSQVSNTEPELRSKT